MRGGRPFDERSAALQQRDAGRIARMLLEAGDRAVEVTPAVRLERELVRARGGQVRDLLAGRAEQLVHEDARRLPLHRYAVQQAEDELPLRLLDDGPAGDGVDPVLLAQALQARGEVHAVAERGVAEPLGRAEVPYHHPVAMKPEPGPQRGDALPRFAGVQALGRRPAAQEPPAS